MSFTINDHQAITRPIPVLVMVQRLHRLLLLSYSVLCSGDPYFHGPWFVRPSEVDHPASRMFCKQELLMSSIHDTNPMRSIQGRCAILDMQTYVKGRITEISETDVFVCESRYNEADKLIRRLKGLKVGCCGTPSVLNYGTVA